MSEKHVVVQGEYFARIARSYGFANWRALYDRPENAALRERRPNPNLLLPGDIVVLPAGPARAVPCATGASHRFRLRRRPDRLRTVLRSAEGAPLAHEPYTLTFPGTTLSGQTDQAGLIDRELPEGAEVVTLQLTRQPWLVFSLSVGHLDPVHDPEEDQHIITGVQARLNNLGYLCGPVDGELGEKTRQAIERFQEAVLGRTSPGGALDQETLEALVSGYGC